MLGSSWEDNKASHNGARFTHSLILLMLSDVAYSNLSLVVQQSAEHAESKIQTVPGFFWDAAKSIPTGIYNALSRTKRDSDDSTTSKQKLVVLDSISGRFRAGRSTLILAPPGAGKSALLKILSQRLASKEGLSGSVTYAGRSGDDVCVPRLVSLCPQADEHYPQMTVREVLTFAVASQHVLNASDVSSGGVCITSRVNELMGLLHLEECADTIVGSEMQRGISGGQRKRVTIAEALAGGTHRVLLLDEFSTGLDAAVTLELTQKLRQWAVGTNGTLVAAMLQPTPETYACFDDVLLLMEGRVVFHAQRELLPGYLQQLGFRPPAPVAVQPAAKVEAGEGAASDNAACSGASAQPPQTAASSAVDFADWVTELLSHPRKTWEASLHADSGSSATTPPPLTPAELAAAWLAHPLSKELMKIEPTAAASSSSSGVISSAMYARPFARSYWAQVALLTGRQWKLTVRDLPFLFARSGGAAIMGLILGSLFWRTGIADFYLKLGCILFAIIHLAFGGGLEVPSVIELRHVAYKQVSAHLFRPSQYVLGYFFGSSLPIGVLESVIFSVIVYWMSGFSADAGRFLFWVLLLLMICIAEGAYFRSVAFFVPRIEVRSWLYARNGDHRVIKAASS